MEITSGIHIACFKKTEYMNEEDIKKEYELEKKHIKNKINGIVQKKKNEGTNQKND